MDVLTTDVFDEWFTALRDREARQRIAVRIRRLGMGNLGQHRVLTGGVTELKIDFGPGYRVYFTTRAGIICILLCGGDKRTQERDIDTALRLAKEIRT
jgi:putative addiction module killer protein